MIKGRINRLKDELEFLWCLLKNYNVSKSLSQLSMLSEENIKDFSSSSCHVCKSDDIIMFARLPVNIPPGQNHSLLYFDYDKSDMDFLKNKKDLLDKTLGFFVSVCWHFCNNCRNGSLSASFNSEHMLEYYINYYNRAKEADQLRRNTKELHGRFLSSLLPLHCIIFEAGGADGITAESLAKNGHKVYVYEPSKQFSKQLKQSLYLTYIDDYTSLSGAFDAIYLHHVLEHIPDPINYLRTLYPLLKNNGLILIQVPDLSLQFGIIGRILMRGVYSIFNRPYFSMDGIACRVSNGKSANWFDALANDHITAFTKEGMEYILKESNYHLKTIIQSTEDRVTYNNTNYAWPVDEETGNTPNGLTVIARKK